MNVIVTKETDFELMSKAFNSTVRFDSHVTPRAAYRMMHSPIRTQEFYVQMLDIPTFVSTHFVRHKIGCEHFVLSNRSDRNGVLANRLTPVNHSMKLNAEALITIARKRLCLKASKETLQVMNLIKHGIKQVDPDLAMFLVPECVYRNGLCPEGKMTCGKKDAILKKYEYYKALFE